MSTPLHTPSTTGRRGTGAPTPGRQPDQPHRHATGRRAAADPQHPVVSAHRPSAAPQRGGHRERHSPDRATGPTSGGRDPGPHPRQPSGPRRRNRLASKWEQRLRLDFQHPHRTLLPAAGSGQGGGGRSAGRVILRSTGQRFLRRLPPLRWPQATVPLRDIHDLVALYPKDTALASGPRQSIDSTRKPKPSLILRPQRRRVAQLAWERQLLVICQPFLADPLAVQAKLCRRIERHIKELFVFVAEPDVPSDNNPAERSLRHWLSAARSAGAPGRNVVPRAR